METAVTITEGKDGIRYLDHDVPLEDYPLNLTDRLMEWSAKQPDRTFVAARDAEGEWERISYAQAKQKVLALGQALLDLGLGPDKPLAILSGNSLSHAMLGLACQHVGIPYSPVSTAYSLISTDFGKLKHVVGLLKPALVFVENVAAFVPAIKALEGMDDVSFEVLTQNADSNEIPVLSLDSLLETKVTEAVDVSIHAISGCAAASVVGLATLEPHVWWES